MATPRFIYFDLGNVLVHFDHHRGARQMAAVAGVSKRLVWEVVFESELELEYERGTISTREFYEVFCDRTGTLPEYEALLFAASDIFELNGSIVPLLSELRERGNRLGILSNTNESHWNFITDGRFPIIQEYFELYALSYEMRVTKPDIECYQRAAAFAGVDPEDIFFTDDRADNVAGALTAKFDAVQYTGVDALRSEMQLRRIVN
ncbi:MAG: HAD family phosphatase [Planctomycetaceae bacterium]|nr:HAD family phosphatase [Planctomycetaceae bacterium]